MKRVDSGRDEMAEGLSREAPGCGDQTDDDSKQTLSTGDMSGGSSEDPECGAGSRNTEKGDEKQITYADFDRMFEWAREMAKPYLASYRQDAGDEAADVAQRTTARVFHSVLGEEAEKRCYPEQDTKNQLHRAVRRRLISVWRSSQRSIRRELCPRCRERNRGKKINVRELCPRCRDRLSAKFVRYDEQPLDPEKQTSRVLPSPLRTDSLLLSHEADAMFDEFVKVLWSLGLPERQLRYVWEHAYRGLSYQEIAAKYAYRYGDSESNIKNLVLRGIDKLRKSPELKRFHEYFKE